MPKTNSNSTTSSSSALEQSGRAESTDCAERKTRKNKVEARPSTRRMGPARVEMNRMSQRTSQGYTQPAYHTLLLGTVLHKAPSCMVAMLLWSGHGRRSLLHYTRTLPGHEWLQ